MMASGFQPEQASLILAVRSKFLRLSIKVMRRTVNPKETGSIPVVAAKVA